MKRILAVLLAITLTGSLTACGTGKKEETKAGQETKAAQEVKTESKDETSAAQEEAGASVLHVDGDDHGSEFAHATLAVQLQAQTGQLSGASEPYALFFAFAEVFDPVTSPVAQAWPEFVAPASPSFRSLPPAGRAPPLHA